METRGAGMSVRNLSVVPVLALLQGTVACGAVEEGHAVGEPLVFLQEYVTEESPLGIWCIGRAGPLSERCRSVVPEIDTTGARGSRLVKLGGEMWLSLRVAREGQVEAWVAPMDGCERGSVHRIEGSPLWSNTAPVYLSIDENGVLRLGVPGDEAVVVAESGVTDSRWSPRGTRAWYLRESARDASLTDLFVLDVDAAAPTATPLLVAGDVRVAAWATDESWLAFVSGSSAALGVWSAEQDTRTLIEYGEGREVELHPSPDSRGLMVRLPEVLTADGDELPREYHFVSLRDGNDQLLLAGEETTGDVEWLWPEPWLQHSHDEVSILYDASGSEAAYATELVGRILQLGPVSRVAVHELDRESVQLATALPMRIEPMHEIVAPYLGAFSPDGQYWAELVSNADERGQVLDHGNQVYVVEAKRDGASWLVADLDALYLGIGGARWLDRTTFAFTHSDRSRPTVSIVGLTDGGWRIEHLSLPAGGPSGGELLLAPGSDPCQIFSARIGQPGCATRWH